MIRKKMIKTFALGLCISAMWTGAAFAQSGGGSSPAYVGTVNTQDQALFEKQREMDQYLFVDHVKDIEKLGFMVVYTGIAKDYVEVGITPYSEENAKILYDLFGKDLVKVVASDPVIFQSEPLEAPDADVDNAGADITDTGDTPVSATASDGILMEKDEIEDTAIEEEEFKIQIQAFEEAEEKDLAEETDEILYATGSEENAEEVIDELKRTSIEDDNIRTISDKDSEKEEKKLSIPGMAAAIAGGVVLLGASTVALKKKKMGKDIK